LNDSGLKTILLVNQDVMLAEADAEMVRSFGYAVIIANSGEKAIELASSGRGVNLILMDIDLGSAAHAMIRRRKVPILFFTDHLDQKMASTARTIPCYGIVARSSGKIFLQTSIEMALALFEEQRAHIHSKKYDQDILEAEQALRESELRLHQILSVLHETIWLREVDTRQVLYVNPAFERLCGLRREEFFKDPNAYINIIHPEDQDRILKGSIYRSDIHRIVRPDGSIRWVWGRTFPVKNELGEVYRTAAIVEDITERKQTEEALKLANEKLIAQMQEIQLLQSNLRDQVIRDPLTNLYNRRYLSETLERELDRARREGYPVSLMMVDIDAFKQVNDTYGHFAGDLVLKHLASHLTRQARPSDLVCRLGGDEFLLVFPNTCVMVAVERAAQCCASFKESAVVFDQVEIRATLSIGIALFPDHGATSQGLIAAADRAMYAAKTNGRNRVVCAATI
jgi:diguanylate cyclase (GGDEF)-like protein/PAS domain S-box-containing protein